MYVIIKIMKVFDYYFHYKYVLRFLLLEKIGKSYINTYKFPRIYKLNTFFVIKDLVDFENLKSSNYFFFFKYFFGKKAFFLNYSSVFSLNVLYHNFNVQLNFVKKDIYFYLNFLFNDILPFCNNRYLIINSENRNYVLYIINDMNFFLEKKTHVGFFNLNNSLNIKFFCFGNRIDKTILLSLLKF